MKKFDVRFKVISENVITIPAYSKKEAIDKARDLLSTTNIKDLSIKNITKHYVIIDIKKDSFFKKNK